MANTGAIIVKAGAITSSPFLIPRDARAKCNAVVPLVVDTPDMKPQYCANLCSNSPMYLPREEIQLPLMQSVTYSNSFPARYGSHTGIIPYPPLLMAELTTGSFNLIRPFFPYGNPEPLLLKDMLEISDLSRSWPLEV